MANFKNSASMLTIDSFGGIDRESSPANAGKALNQVNFRITPDKKIQKRYGYRLYCDFGGELRGIAYSKTGQEKALYAVVGQSLLAFDGETVSLKASLSSPSGEVCMFSYAGRLIIFDGSDIFSFDGLSLKREEGYAPLIICNSDQYGSGTECEKQNLITNRVRMRFTVSSGSSIILAGNVSEVNRVLIDGVETEAYNISQTDGKTTLAFISPPPRSSNSVEVEYTLAGNDRRAELVSFTKAALSQSSGGRKRIFLYGDKSKPEYVCFSELCADSEGELYFPASNLNDMNDRVTGVCAFYGNDMIFTESETWRLTTEKDRTLQSVQLYSHTFTQLSDACGNISASSPVFLTNEVASFDSNGVYLWKSTAVSDEKRRSLISSRVRDLLTKDFLASSHVHADRMKGELWISSENRTAVYSYLNDAWYLFEGFSPDGYVKMPGDTVFFKRGSGRAYIFDEAIYTDDGEIIKAKWESDYLDFGSPANYKNLHRVFLSLRPEESGNAVLTLQSDTGKTVVIGDKNEFFSSVFSFSPMDFTRFTFNCDFFPSTYRRRVNIRRFSHLKIIIENNEGGKCTLHKLELAYQRVGETRTRDIIY